MSDHLVIGGQLGNYLIDSVIGRGGMSVVYRAKHSRLAMSVALKVLAPELSSDDTFRERFLREAQLAAGIDHPNVIPIHDMGLHENSLYIVMRYIAGGDLTALLTTSGPLEAERALTLLMPIALALDAAHAHELVHRDVKPANILIQRSTTAEIEHVYLTDFGIAKSASFAGGLTGAGGSIGTVGYMAPEQFESREVSAETDVYALAATFYECITGRVPFQRELAEGARPPVGALEPISSVRPDLPSALDGVIVKALSRNPVDRYETCELFLRACGYALEGRAPETGGVARTAVAETQLSPGERTAAVPERSPAVTGSGGEPPPAHDADAPPPARRQSRPASRKPDRPGLGGRLAARRWYAAALLGALVGGVVAVVLLSSSSTTQPGELSSSALLAVPTNHVTGSGNATLRLNGNAAAVTITTSGLDNGAALVHAMHIHAGGKGQCPPASAARPHNGHLAISTTDGINYYGPPVQALTTRGDTSPSSILVFSRYLTGGTLNYTRTITLPPRVAAYVRQNNAVVVVHGIDYDGTGIYSGVLDPSELNKSVPGTATAPALCGRLVVPPRVAARNSRSRSHALVYTASLVVYNAAPRVPTSGLFYCDAGDATAAAGETWRRSPTKATAPSGRAPRSSAMQVRTGSAARWA